MAARRRVPRTIAGAWGVLTPNGPFYYNTGLPVLYTTKDAALKDCVLADMKPVRVTVRYPLLRPRR